MTVSTLDTTRSRLLDERAQLVATIDQVPNNAHSLELLSQVDAALGRLSTGTYGLCETCHEPISAYRLRVDPLIQSCSRHPTSDEQKRAD